MVQLWVNLPAKDKMAPPRYQSIVSNQIPTVSLPDGHGVVRVIAGEFAGAQGPAKTFTPIHVWDLRLTSDQRMGLAIPEGYTTALVVLTGALRVHGSEPVAAAEVGLFDRAGRALASTVRTTRRRSCCVARPIDEPIVGYGPFVMNSAQEIRQAIADYQSGKMGHLS